MLHTKLCAGNRAAALGLSVFALAFGMTLTACDSGGGGGGGGNSPVTDDLYEVKVSPQNSAVMKGETQTFLYDFTKNGKNVTGTTAMWTVDGGAAGTTITAIPDGNPTLTVAEDETAEELRVTAAVTYGDAAYTGSANVKVVSKEQVLEAFEAIRNAANAGALLTALKDPKNGLDVSLVLDANKDEYWNSLNDFSDRIGYISESTPLSDIRNKIQQINYLLENINFTQKTKTILDSFNNASNADGIAALLTEANFNALELEWNEYNILSAVGKIIVADAVFRQKPSNGFSSGRGLAQSIYSAVYERLRTEADTLASQFNEKSKDQIKTLLTQANLTLLEQGDTELWERYNSLNAVQKEAFAEALADSNFGSLDILGLLLNAMNDAYDAIMVESNIDQIKTKLNTAISGSATAAQINDLFTYLETLGIGGSNGEQLPADKEGAFNAAIVKAQLGRLGYTAIMAYLDAGASAGVDFVSPALSEVSQILSEIMQGRTRGEITFINLPPDISYFSGTIYDSTTMPASYSEIYQLRSVNNFYNNATITGTSATIILRWNSAYGTTTRNFLVSVSYNSGAVVGLVAFTNGSADDMVDFSAMTDRNDL
jgi:hypothetical protein